jgi:hypothetical protein
MLQMQHRGRKSGDMEQHREHNEWMLGRPRRREREGMQRHEECESVFEPVVSDILMVLAHI